MTDTYDHQAARRAYWNGVELLKEQPVMIMDDMRPTQVIAGELFAKCMGKLIGVEYKPTDTAIPVTNEGE